MLSDLNVEGEVSYQQRVGSIEEHDMPSQRWSMPVQVKLQKVHRDVYANRGVDTNTCM